MSDVQKTEAGGKANPEKNKAVSQVLDELGFGKAEVPLEEMLYNMAEKIAELCYEVKQIRENS